MTIDESNSTHLKISLLSKVVDFPLDLFNRYEGDFYDNKYVYGKTSRVKFEHRLPQVLLLGDGVVSAILRRENSPWKLKLEDNLVLLYNQDRFIRELKLPETPAYFGRKLRDGTPAESIIAVAGEDTPGFFLFPECFYFEILIYSLMPKVLPSKVWIYKKK